MTPPADDPRVNQETEMGTDRTATMSETTQDCYEYVRTTYGVPARVGMRVKVEDGRGGVIVKASSDLHYVHVRFDGDSFASNCHPDSLNYSASFLSEQQPIPAPLSPARTGERETCKHSAGHFEITGRCVVCGQQIAVPQPPSEEPSPLCSAEKGRRYKQCPNCIALADAEEPKAEPEKAQLSLQEKADRYDLMRELEKSELPCGHLNQFSYSPDNWKHIYCAMCSVAALSTLRGQIETAFIGVCDNFQSVSHSAHYHWVCRHCDNNQSMHNAKKLLAENATFPAEKGRS